jgi:hypothetical protein
MERKIGWGALAVGLVALAAWLLVRKKNR